MRIMINATAIQIPQGIKIRFFSRKSNEICLIITIDNTIPNKIPNKLKNKVSIIKIERIAPADKPTILNSFISGRRSKICMTNKLHRPINITIAVATMIINVLRNSFDDSLFFI